MSQFNISINHAEGYLLAISGLTRLSKKESQVLASIINFMIDKNLFTIDDTVRDHIMIKYNYKQQSYANLISKFRKKKLLVDHRNQTKLKPMLLPGTVLQLTFADIPVALEEFNVPEEKVSKETVDA